VKPATTQTDGTGPERRHITTVFCDLIGSTTLALRLDPEEYGELIFTYRDICSDNISKCGGAVNRFMGDGIVSCFGYPQSHEDDPVRACRAGIQIIAALREALPSLEVRIAAASGLVLSSDVGRDSLERHSFIGSVPYLAARLQAQAPPGGMLISDELRSLVGEALEVEDFGFHDLKGIDHPVRAWRVLSERQVESRFASRSSRGEVGLVGRQDELDLLLDRWRAACTDGSQRVMVYGEPGIGKSRLVHELRRRLAPEHCTMLLFQCSSHHAGSMLHAVTAHIAYAAKIAGKDSTAGKLQKLRTLFDGYPEEAQSLMPLFAELLAIPTADEFPPLDLTPGQRKARTFSALTKWVMHRAATQPTLLVIEDYHWIDPTTAEWLEFLMSQLGTIPLLCVVTSRSKHSNLTSRPGRAAEIELSRLSADDSIDLITRLAGGEALPIEMVDTIMSRTEGVPLFIEALTKSVLSSALLPEDGEGTIMSKRLAAVSVPMTLQDLLSARLDSLGRSKLVAQLGSVLGRTFSFEMLARMWNGTPEMLREALHRLVDADLLIAEDATSDAGYTFKHALIQNAAYEGLLLRTRRRLHERVADVLTTHSREVIDAHPELLAFHLARSENFVEAARQWQRAGVLSTRRSASREAVLHFESALAALERVPISLRDRQRELDTLIGLAGALRATRGFSAAEVGDASQRSLHLARAIGSHIGELQALNGMYSYFLVSARYVEAEAAARELLEVAVREGQNDYTMIGYRAVGAVSFHLGRLREAEASLQHALSMYDQEQHAHLTSVYGSNHAETCACFLSLTKFALGARAEAIRLQSWAIEHSRAINHAHSLAQALGYRAFLFCLANDPERTEADAKMAITLSGEHRFQLMEYFASCSMDIARATRVPSRELINALEQSIGRCHLLAPNALQPFLLTVTAELYSRIGIFERGLALLDEADETMRQTKELWAEAESRRVRGRLLAKSGAVGPAEACFREAITIAQSQGAETWRERAATDLCTLLRRSVQFYADTGSLAATSESRPDLHWAHR
jgi:predicted ATPase/class 3 adenylate cyclase